MSAVDTVLAKFSNPKASGGQWLVRCPAHEDRKASLAVRERDGVVLLKCHAGCEVSSILAALNLSEADLFPPKAPKPQIIATYPYTDEAGTLLYEVVRFQPKDFRQRRPDGAGGWTWNLSGCRRVLYRLDALKDQSAVVVVEGEKDANALWALGIPTTTHAGGAGKWLDVYAEQIRRQGVQRIAVLPDNDETGRQHAQAVARSLSAAKVDVRVVELPNVPLKGDVSDYLASGGTKESLLALIRSTPLWTPQSEVPEAPHRDFSSISDTRYVLAVQPEGILLDLDRLHRTHHELVGELSVTVNGSCPDAKGIDGVISTADLNLSSAQARVTRAKLLADRSGNKDLDWHGYLEELCVRVMKSQREGAAVLRFADMHEEEADDSLDVIQVHDFPVLRDHPSVLFGDPGSAKSYLALYFAGELAKGFPVLYCDWELDFSSHNKRLGRIYDPRPQDLYYIKCTQPLVYEGDRIRSIIKKEGIKYVVFDSIGYACQGRPEEAEQANLYWREIRTLGVGSLHLAHTTKRENDDDGSSKGEQKIFGSVFWTAGARSSWFVQRADNSPPGQIQFGLFHRKATFGEKLSPLAYTLHFEGRHVRFERTKVSEVDELAAKLPLLERMKKALKSRALTVKQLAEDTGSTAAVIRTMVSKHPKVLVRIDDKKIGLSAPSMEF